MRDSEKSISIKNLQHPDDLLLIKEFLEEEDPEDLRELELVDVNYVYECVAGQQHIVQIKTYCCPMRQTSRRKNTGRPC